MSDKGTYNGYANWETFTVVSWIANDERCYHIAREYVTTNPRPTYGGLVLALGTDYIPGGVSLFDVAIRRREVMASLRD